MNGVSSIGRLLMFMGIVLVALGAILTFAGRIPSIVRLPGDILINLGNFTLYFPITNGIILSIILSLLFALIGRR